MAFYLLIIDMTETAVTMSLAAIASYQGSEPTATGYRLNVHSQTLPNTRIPNTIECQSVGEFELYKVGFNVHTLNEKNANI